jgi:hypothetical protein
VRLKVKIRILLLVMIYILIILLTYLSNIIIKFTSFAKLIWKLGMGHLYWE